MVISTLKKSGPVRVVYNLIKGCVDEDIEFHVLSISKEPQNNLVNDFLKLNVIYKNLCLTRLSSILNGKKVLFRYVKTNKIVIIHLHGFRPNYLGSLCTIPVKTISTVHNNPYEDYKNRYGTVFGKIMSFSQNMFLKKIDKIVSVSKSNSTLISSKINKKVTTIENGIDTNKFKQLNKVRKQLREKLELKDTDLLFISVGHLSPIKNPFILIEAFKKTEIKGSKLIFIGDGKLRKECESRIKNDNRIILLGHQDHVVDYLSASDVFISASITEGMPNAVLEAVSCNNILLLSNIPSHIDVLSKGNIGYSFSIDKLTSLKEKIDKVYKSGSKFNNKEVRAIAVNKFDYIIMSKRYKKLYYEN